jgi:hypothetical protein
MGEIHPEKRLIGYSRVSTYRRPLIASLSSFAPPDAAAGMPIARSNSARPPQCGRHRINVRGLPISAGVPLASARYVRSYKYLTI